MTSNMHSKLSVVLACFLSMGWTTACGTLAPNSAATPTFPVTATATSTPMQTPLATFQPETPTATFEIPSAAPQEVVITLERTVCFGTCPAYLLTIRGDGTVFFEGRQFVKSMGLFSTKIDPQQVKDLVAEFERIHYFYIPNFTDYDVTDAPSANTSITLHGITKTVDHYYGDRDAPQALFELEAKIDEVANSKQWIGE